MYLEDSAVTFNLIQKYLLLIINNKLINNCRSASDNDKKFLISRANKNSILLVL